MNKKLIILTASIMTACILLPQLFILNLSNAQTDVIPPPEPALTIKYFLSIDLIQGEVMEPHEYSIEVLSFGWGENATQANSGQSNPRPPTVANLLNIEDFKFLAYSSKASPSIFLNCAQGKYLDSAILYIDVLVGSSYVDHIEWHFRNVKVTSYETISNTEGTIPIDTFSISFERIGIVYRGINEDGSTDNPISEGWDVRLKQTTNNWPQT